MIRPEELTCIKEDIDENIFMYKGCKTSMGEIEEVLFCREGIYIVFDKLDYSIRTTYQRLREILKTQYIYIYVQDEGYYDYSKDKYIVMEFENFFDQTFNEIYTYTDEEITLIEKRLRIEDATIRGSYVDDEGKAYIKSGSNFREISFIESDKIYYLCLFFGCLGVHRFRMKKWFSGACYLLTLGFLGAGWITDLCRIYFGVQTDKKKRLLLPVSKKRVKLIMTPLGILVSTIYIRFMLTMIIGI